MALDKIFTKGPDRPSRYRNSERLNNFGAWKDLIAELSQRPFGDIEYVECDDGNYESVRSGIYNAARRAGRAAAVSRSTGRALAVTLLPVPRKARG